MIRIIGAFLFSLIVGAAQAQVPGGGSPMVPNGVSCQCDLFAFSTGTQLANVTFFNTPAFAGANQNFAAISPRNGTFKNFYWRVATAPGVGNSVVLTLYVGTIVSMNATSVTCTISDTNQTCSNTANTATITAGQAWAIQEVTSVSATSTGQQMGGIEQDIQ